MTIDVATTPRRKLTTKERLSVWERDKGHCAICGRKLAPGDVWQADHPRALGLGGPDCLELLRVICSWCYPEKNADDTRRIAKAKRGKARHVGAKAKSQRGFKGWRRFDGTLVRAS
jgi:5-methylcytosine-specific restriction endonuclease McrA